MASIPTRRILLATRPCLHAAAAAAARISHSSPFSHIARARLSIAAGRASSSPQKPSTRLGTSSARHLSSSAPESKIWAFEDIKATITTPGTPATTIIDVREASELQSTGKIPGASNVPITTWPDSFHISDAEFAARHGFPRPAKDAAVVFYCKAGVRSRAAAGIAREAGWTNVGEYPGSWNEWSAKGGDVERC
ncbi:Rhodanese-like domain-containing protein [Xylaria telfairii]|nr:Rhodanese-like domain-containing protein [Xylaria telfairii]